MADNPKLTHLNRRYVSIPDTLKILAELQRDLQNAEADYEADPTLAKWNDILFMREKVQQYEDRASAREA